MKEKLTLPERPSGLFLLAVLDILVLLLIFFLLVTSAVQQAGMEIDRLVSSFRLRAANDQRVALTVTVGPPRTLYLNQKPVKMDELPDAFERLRAEEGIEEVVIDADGRLDLSEAMELVEMAQLAGLNAMIGARAALEGGEAEEDRAAPPVQEDAGRSEDEANP